MTIPVFNLTGARLRLPARQTLGTWIPLDVKIKLLEDKNELKRQRVTEWLQTLKTKGHESLRNEDMVDLSALSRRDRELVLGLLRSYPDVLNKREDCPSATTIGVEHHINTGSAPPVFQRRLRQSERENTIVTKHVNEML